MKMSRRIHSLTRAVQCLNRIRPNRLVALFPICLALGCTDVASTGPAAPATADARNAALPPPIQAIPAIETAPVAAPPAASAPVAEQPVAPAAPAPDGASEPAQPRRIIGETTTNVRDAAAEQAKGATKAPGKVTGKDPITVSGNTYTVIIGKAEQLQIKKSLDLFYNLHERYPKDLQEFMKEIIKANGIRLAQLPFYQEYAYDAAKHELIILEYPDKKAQLPGGGK
jgi:hypothetical protein